MIETEKIERFLIASILPQTMTDEEAFLDLKEIKDLVDAYGGKVIEFVIQHREAHDKGPYIGRGKIDEVSTLVKEKEIAIVVLNAIIKPGQLFDIKRIIHKNNPQIQVWDRVDLILNIFSKHATTTEAKLQIELAAMRHMGPSIYGMGYVLSRQGGSIGTRGVGETNTELMRRHWRTQMKKIQDKIDKLSQDREKQLERRRKNGLYTVSLVGYTNAGKTSLFNLVTGKKQLVENALFATLDSHVSRLYLPGIKKEIIITDTIGFIKNLPPALIYAFRSTLMESLSADILLHVIDSSDEDLKRKIATVNEVLHTLNLGQKEQLFVFNKIDLIDDEKKASLTKRYQNSQQFFISTTKGTGLPELIHGIEHMISKQLSPAVEPKKIHVED